MIPESDKELLMKQISEQIQKVAEILYLFSMGSSQTKIVRKYGFSRATVISVLTDYADALGKFRELSGRLSAKNYISLSSLEEDLIEKVRDRMDNDPEMAVSFRDLKELSIAKANANREAMTARGEATNITEGRKVYTTEDYEATIKAARDRIKEAKVISVEIVNEEGDGRGDS